MIIISDMGALVKQNFERSTFFMNELVPMITEQNGIPVTTSRAIAEQFERSHKHILRDIQNTLEQLNQTDEGRKFGQSNFGLTEYTTSQNKPQPMYLLTRDGFTLLAMGFTGAKAMQFKVAYINAFDRMEQLIKGGITSGALQSIEQRLTALESASEQGKAEATDSISQSFLQAIKQALDSDKYYLYNKWERTPKEPQGEILGYIEGNRLMLFSSVAYKIYSNAVKSPIPNPTIWRVLEVHNTIYNRQKYGNTRQIKKQELGVIYLDTDKITDLKPTTRADQ